MSPHKPIPSQAGSEDGELKQYPPWAPPPSHGPNQKSPEFPPVVTVFGAGVAGLSAAHELIERGFSVQVVEPERSPDDEYAAEVGGMARNQFGRVKENPQALYKDLSSDYQNVLRPQERRKSRETVKPVLFSTALLSSIYR